MGQSAAGIASQGGLEQALPGGYQPQPPAPAASWQASQAQHVGFAAPAHNDTSYPALYREAPEMSQAGESKRLGFPDRQSFVTDAGAGSPGRGGGTMQGGPFVRGNSFATDVAMGVNVFDSGMSHASEMHRGVAASPATSLALPATRAMPYPRAAADESMGPDFDRGSFVASSSSGAGPLGAAPPLGSRRPSWQGAAPGPCDSVMSSMVGSTAEDGPCPREAWDSGDIVEVYAKTVQRWFPARVDKVTVSPQDEDIISVQFSAGDGLKVKSMYRSDAMLAEFGTNLFDALPPGFEKRPSASRPGQMVYFDATTGTKYSSGCLAWRVHLERLLQQPEPTLQQTVCSVGTAAVKPAFQSVGGGALAPQPWQGGGGGQGSGTQRPLSLAELQQQPSGLCEDRRPAAMDAPSLGLPRGGVGGLVAHGPEEGGGKAPLPKFAEARSSSQAAYLRHICAVPGVAAGGGGIPEDAAVEYQTPAGARALPPAQRPPPRPSNPGLQAWQDDPFSQWRT